jgi:hypothetical protein
MLENGGIFFSIWSPPPPPFEGRKEKRRDKFKEERG